MALSDETFRCELQRAFGHRLGRIERVGQRGLHALSRVTSGALSDRRTLLVGNAAVSLHPVAGQAFNLALRDVATIAELIADDAATQGERADAGSGRVLERYGEWRRDDQRKVAWFTHGLIRGFGAHAPGTRRPARSGASSPSISCRAPRHCSPATPWAWPAACRDSRAGCR